jgi:DNA-binding CsgD family transcriptional regulator
VDDSAGVASALTELGRAAYAQGDLAQAMILFEEGLKLRRGQADDIEVARSLRHVGKTAVTLGNRRRSTEALCEALLVFQRVEYARGIGLVLEQCGQVAIAAGEPRSGVRLCSAAAAQCSRVQCVVPPAERPWSERALSVARSRLGRRTFDAEWTLGQAMSVSAAIELAQAISDAIVPSRKLTGRERDVAGLIAAGLSNRQIAHDLAISERTVEVHVSNALRKLDLKSRTQVALWAKAERERTVAAAASTPGARSGEHSLGSHPTRGRLARSRAPRSSAG